MTDAQALCLIPARGTSSGLPKKNFKRIDGTSLVGHTTQAAQTGFVYTDNKVSRSELNSHHNLQHNLNGMKEPLDDESVQSTNPDNVKGEKKKSNQQENHQKSGLN